jgi:Protein of unknown function (DUF3365)
MRGPSRSFIHLVVGIAILATLGSSAATKAGAERQESQEPNTESLRIPVKVVADYLHAIIEAERAFYTLNIVERLQQKGVINSTEKWRGTNSLPLPAQFLNETSELARLTGTKLRYQLISLWPINPQNAPSNEFERKGLERVRTDPDQPYTRVVRQDEKRVYQAMYADVAVTQACIGCHNADPRSPKRDFKLRDVMGAVEITIPLE